MLACLLAGSLVVAGAAGGLEPAATRAGGRLTTGAHPETRCGLWWREAQIEGLNRQGVEVEDAVAYFGHVFAHLPKEVMIYPSENYHYFEEMIGGRHIRGNLRLAAGLREQGVLSFWYEEVRAEGSGGPGGPLRGKDLTLQDGLGLRAKDPFTWEANFGGRTVTFHLHRLKQEPPRLFALRTNEVFVMRTFDESGLQFFLLFNAAANYFVWLLNEEESVPEHFDQPEPDILVGRRTGFVFWADPADAGRKLLASVSAAAVAANTYADGPFDQLADNYAEETQIARWLVRAMPELAGRIDRYGNFTDRPEAGRVALTNYGTHRTLAEARALIARAKASSDPARYIAGAGGGAGPGG